MIILSFIIGAFVGMTLISIFASSKRADDSSIAWNVGFEAGKKKGELFIESLNDEELLQKYKEFGGNLNGV